MVAPVGRGAGQCLGLVLDRQNAVADREAVTGRQVLQATRALGADVVVMGGLPANHAAECDEPIEPIARPRGKADRRWDLERTRNLQAFVGSAGCRKGTLGATTKLRSDMGVIRRLDEQNVRRLGHGVGRRSRAT